MGGEGGWIVRGGKYNTRSVQRCWIDSTRTINDIASHTIHRGRDRMGCLVHDDQLLYLFQASGGSPEGRSQSRRTDRAGARKRP